MPHGAGSGTLYYAPVAFDQQSLAPHRLFFPVAAVFAAAVVPLWLALRAAGLAAVSGTWHGHEMLFGYALAVVAGFLVTRTSVRARWLLLLTWIAARAGAAVEPGPIALAAGLAFPLALAAAATPPLWRGAKRRENLIVPGVAVLLVAADAGWWAGAVWLGPWVQQRALLSAVDLFTLLVLIVGGRALPAAVGGHMERRGISRRDRIRRGYELPLAGLVGTACLLDALGLAAPAGWLSITAALVTLARVRTWQLGHSLRRPELWSLALGYLWLIPGLLLKGLAQATGVLPPTDGLHGITVGAIGTLTLVMMARTYLAREHRPLDGLTGIGAGAVLVAAAALLRLLASPLAPARPTLLWLAVACWSLAFILLLLRLLRVHLPQRSVAAHSRV